MASIAKKSLVLGMVAGLIVPPLICKLYIYPSMVLEPYKEVVNLRHTIDHLGWHVRNLQEEAGIKEENLYVPMLYFQGH